MKTEVRKHNDFMQQTLTEYIVLGLGCQTK